MALSAVKQSFFYILIVREIHQELMEELWQGGSHPSHPSQRQAPPADFRLAVKSLGNIIRVWGRKQAGSPPPSRQRARHVCIILHLKQSSPKLHGTHLLSAAVFRNQQKSSVQNNPHAAASHPIIHIGQISDTLGEVTNYEVLSAGKHNRCLSWQLMQIPQTSRSKGTTYHSKLRIVRAGRVRG